MPQTERLISLIKSVPSPALPISLTSNSFILVAEAKVLTTPLHSSLTLVVLMPSTGKSCGLSLQSTSLIRGLPTTSIATALAPGILVTPLTVDSQPGSQSDAFKCKSNYIAPLLRSVQWLTKCPDSNPQGLCDLVSTTLDLSLCCSHP